MISMRKLMLLALLGAAVPAMAANALGVATQITAAPPQNAAADDDEDEEVPAPVTPTKVDAAKSGAATPSAASPTPDAPAAAPSSESFRLVSGAPLYNPHVAVHIVEKKAHSDARKAELVLYPVATQINGKFTQHLGTMGSFVYHLQENFGLQVSGGYNWHNVEATFNQELVEKYNVAAQQATSLLWTWGALGGVEVTPFYGKFAFFEGTLAHFSFVVNAGVGAGGTRHMLKPDGQAQDGTPEPATYGNTGTRFMASLGAGFRLQLGERFAFRLEVRDVVYTARMERVNGCDLEDLKALQAKYDSPSHSLDEAQVSGTCDVNAFKGVIDGTNYNRGRDINFAKQQVEKPTSDVLSNVGLYWGFSFLF